MNLLKLLNLTGIIPSPITVYLMLAIAAGSAWSGGWVVYKFWQASEVTAVNEARAAEHDAVLLGDSHSRGVLERARQRKEANEAALDELRGRLAAVPACDVPVPGEWVRRDKHVPRAPADPGRARSAHQAVDPAPRAEPVPAAPVADARDVVLTCEKNRTEVYQPEADERSALRAWYEDLRRRYNR